MNRARIQFQDCSVEQLTIDPAEKGSTAVLVLAAPLGKDNAELLRCGYLYKTNGDAHEMQEGHSISNMMRDVDLCLPTLNGALEHFLPELIWKFKVVNNGPGLGVRFRVQCKSNHLDLAEFVLRTNKETFECAIVSAQGEFDFTGENPGGTAVDMGSRTVDQGPLFACPDCDADIPLNADGTDHTDPETGEVRRCLHPSAEQVAARNGGPALASAIEVDGRKKEGARAGAGGYRRA